MLTIWSLLEALQEHGQCSRAELAGHLERPVDDLGPLIAQARRVGLVRIASSRPRPGRRGRRPQEFAITGAGFRLLAEARSGRPLRVSRR